MTLETGLDQKTIRATLASIGEELQALDERREALVTAARGLEVLLSLTARNISEGEAQTLFPLPAKVRQTTPKGLVSLRSAVLRVIKEAGEELHAEEVYRRAGALGARTSSKNPIAIVDLMLYSLKKSDMPVEKVGPRRWKWVGET